MRVSVFLQQEQLKEIIQQRRHCVLMEYCTASHFQEVRVGGLQFSPQFQPNIYRRGRQKILCSNWCSVGPTYS